MGRAEDLFDRCEKEGIDFVTSLIRDRATEGLFLDFKRAAKNGSETFLATDDFNTLKKSISGFANSEGGIIIWGVDCSKSNDDGDVASDFRLIENPQRFCGLLEGKVSACTSPPVAGVRSLPIPVGNGDKGIVVTYIPQSPSVPHQVAGEGKYMIRIGSSFQPAPHAVLAGLFGRAPHPYVYPNYIIQILTVNSEAVEFAVNFAMINDGVVLANDLYVSLMIICKDSRVKFNYQTCKGWTSNGAFGVDTSWVSNIDIRLAPGGNINVGTLQISFPSTISSPVLTTLRTGCKGAIPYFRNCKSSLESQNLLLQKIIVGHAADPHGKELFDDIGRLIGIIES